MAMCVLTFALCRIWNFCGCSKSTTVYICRWGMRVRPYSVAQRGCARSSVCCCSLVHASVIVIRRRLTSHLRVGNGGATCRRHCVRLRWEYKIVRMSLHVKSLVGVCLGHSRLCVRQGRLDAKVLMKRIFVIVYGMPFVL